MNASTVPLELTGGTRPSRTQWLVPVGLILVGLIPIIAGSLRLAELTGGAVVTPGNARFFDSPVPVVVHIVTATLFCLLGAFQFVPALRRQRRWHRMAGRVIVPVGLLSALSGMWMAVFYDLPAHDGTVLLFVRLFFGGSMVASLLIAFGAIRRRDLATHGDWMTRAYALGLGAGTQAILLMPVTAAFGSVDQLARAATMAAAWVVNLLVAEFAILRRRRRSTAVGSREGSTRAYVQAGVERAEGAESHSETMRAATYHHFGAPEVVTVAEVARPAPQAGEVRVRVLASTVSAADHRARSRDIPSGLRLLSGFTIGFRRPSRPVLGMDFAGVVDAVGDGVTNFSVGDEVIAMPGSAYGGHAEYAIIRADGAITLKPQNLDFDAAASLVFGGITALGFMKQIKIAPGDTVLVNGGSGAVGLAAMQLTKHLNAEVTAVTSEKNRELVTEFGADHVIDYESEDFTTQGLSYDAVIDCVGNVPFARLAGVAKPSGAVLHVAADFAAVALSAWRTRRTGKFCTAMVGKYRAEDLAHLVAHAESGQFKPTIDRTYDLADIVEAHRYVDLGRKRGSVVLRIASA